jgi:hypothetical protein
MDIIEIQLKQLLSKLEGKSCYTNLKAIAEGRSKSKTRELIGISSLLTHALIESESNKEYLKLVQDLYSKLGDLLFKLQVSKMK